LHDGKESTINLRDLRWFVFSHERLDHLLKATCAD